jgi:hypothetical protein
LSAATDLGPGDHFSDTYLEAREKFVTAARMAGGKLEHYLNPHMGGDRVPLYSDVASFNLIGADTVLVLISGTHGIEGFAGSAIQTGLLREGVTEHLPEQVGLLFYHALNPYGFHYVRRFNEDNIDLNRNFVDHETTYPENSEYAQLAWLIEPDSFSAWNDFLTAAGIGWYRLTKGGRWLQAAISHGQYAYSKGLFFGGNSKTWSNRSLQEVAERKLTTVSSIIVLDIHTGLGEFAEVEVITEMEAESPGIAWLTKCWDLQPRNSNTGQSVSPAVSGSLKHGLGEMLIDTNVTAVTLEFGTYSPHRIFWALRAENYLHHHGGLEQLEAQAIKSELKEMFYPDDAAWKESVWKEGAALVNKALACLH